MTLLELLKVISLSVPLMAAITEGSKLHRLGFGVLVGAFLAVVCLLGMMRVEKWANRLAAPGFKSAALGNLLLGVAVLWIIACAGAAGGLTHLFGPS